MVFDVELTWDAKRRDAELGEWLLEAFLAAAPASDPVVDQDAESGRTTVAFEVDASDMDAAAVAVIRIVCAAVGGCGRETPMVGLHLDAAGDLVASAGSRARCGREPD